MASIYFCNMTKYIYTSAIVIFLYIRSIFLLYDSNSHEYNREFKVSDRVFCVIVMFFSSVYMGYAIYLQKSINQRSHNLHGNIKFNNLKFAHFNKGNSNFMNKIDNICYVYLYFRLAPMALCVHS